MRPILAENNPNRSILFHVQPQENGIHQSPMIPIFKVKPDLRGMRRFLISCQRSNQQFSHQARIEPRANKKVALKPWLVLGELLKDFNRTGLTQNQRIEFIMMQSMRLETAPTAEVRKSYRTLMRIYLQHPVYDFFQRARLACRR